MLKKFAIAAVVVGAGLGLLHATGLNSYTSTAFSKVRGTFKKSVPLEFELERLRHEVAQLIPEMKQSFSRIADEMVAVENLDKEIKSSTTALAKQKQVLLAMTRDLESGKKLISYDGREYSADRVARRLERDWATYKNGEAEVKSKQDLLDAKQTALDATKERLSSIRVQKQELEVEIAKLEADLKTVRLAQTKNQFHFDDSRLARCKAAVQEMKNRLTAEKYASDLANQFGNEIVPVEKKVQPTSQIIHEIRAHFGDSVTEPTTSVADKQ